MATCRAIENTALRKLGVLGAGREPRDAERNDAHTGLQALYRSMINAGAFGRLRDVVPTGSDYTARENERVFRNGDVTLEVTLPELVPICDGPPRPYDQEYAVYSDQTTDRNMRPPRDCSVVVIEDAFTGDVADFIYDGDLKKWVSIYDLAIDDNAPLSRRDELGLSSLLAMSISDQFGGALTDSTVGAGRLFQSGLVNRWSMPTRAIPGQYM